MKTYTTPQLAEYGSLEELVLSGETFGSPDHTTTVDIYVSYAASATPQS